MPTDAPILGVLFTVFQSILQVFLLSLAGFTLSCKGIVDKPTSKVLNHINIALFTPALLFSKVAYFLTPAKLRQLWVLPIFFTVVTGLSAVTAHFLARAFRLKRSQVNFATAASMFMNSNSLPVALMQSLAATVPLLKWGPDDTINAMFGRSLTYLVVFSTLGMILRWSYGIRLISQADEPEQNSSAPTTYRDADDTAGLPPLTHVSVDPSTTAQLIDYETETDIAPHDQTPLRARPLRSRVPHPRVASLSWRHTQWYIHRHSHLPIVPTSLGDQSESEGSDELVSTEEDSEDTIALRSEPIDTGFSTEVEDPSPAPLPASVPALPLSEPNTGPMPRWSRPIPTTLLKQLFNILTSLSPPLIASLFALFCVLVPPVQQLLQSDAMIPFKGALDNAGACSIPLTLLVLGGWFWDGETKSKDKRPIGDHEVKGGSDVKSKGKGVEKHRSHPIPTTVPTLTGEQHDASIRDHHVTVHSRDSSATSLSSMIGAFGDVLMGRMYSRGSTCAKRRWGNVGPNNADVEPGLLATHTETEHEHAENGGRSRSRSQTNTVNGRTRLSPTSSPSSSSPQVPVPDSVPGNPPGENLTIFVTLLARMVIVPIIVTPLMVLVSRLGWGGQVFEDPVFVVSSMLLVASPPALTLAQISQRAKATTNAGTTGAPAPDTFSPFERLLSRTVFWAYCVLTPPVTIASVMIGLLLVGG